MSISMHDSACEWLALCVCVCKKFTAHVPQVSLGVLGWRAGMTV